MKIVIVGAGAIGTAVAKLLKENRRNSVALWDAVPGKVKGQRPLGKTVPEADAVFFCVPTFALRDAIGAARPFMRRGVPAICTSKGIEAGTNLTMDRLMAKALPRSQPFGLLFGPMLASELASGACAHAASAGDSRARAALWTMFSGTRLSVAKSMDLRGVALCGALKNIYAIGFGILAGLEAGDNMRGAYVVAARQEMREMVALLGGRRDTVDGFAGLGDLVATGLNSSSRNRQIGCALAKGGSRCQGSEGARAAVSVSMLLKKRQARFSVFSSIYRVLACGAPARVVAIAVCAWRP